MCGIKLGQYLSFLIWRRVTDKEPKKEFVLIQKENQRMADLTMLLKPPAFKVKRVGDPEQLAQDFAKYIIKFKEFLEVTEVDGRHTAGHAPAAGGLCSGCKKAKATLRLVGGEQMRNLMEHVGQVLEQDTFTQAITKVEQGIKQQTNQATSCFKLFQQMPQNSKHFAEYYPRVREQAERCMVTEYDAKMDARDAICFQTNNKKLQ